MPPTAIRRTVKSEANKLLPEDRPAHDWYRFVLSYPPHLVREYVQRFGLTVNQHVLDPFCGTGTTIVECKKLGIPSVGIEVNPMAHFASQQKVNWSGKANRLLGHGEQIAEMSRERFARRGHQRRLAVVQKARSQVVPRLATSSDGSSVSVVHKFDPLFAALQYACSIRLLVCEF